MPRQAILPEVITCRAAVSACEKEPAASAGLTSLASEAAPCYRAGCDHVPCSRQGGSSVSGLSSLTSDTAPGHRAGCDRVPCSRRCVRKGGPAASAGFTSLTSNAAPRYRAGCDPVLCGRQGVRRRASSASRPYTSPERCGAMLGCRRRRPPELQRLEESHPMCEHRQGGVKTPRPGSKKRRRMATAKSGGRG